MRVPDDEARDATRRTRLANERTYLAWWRTGLTAFAVSLGAGRLVPELSNGANWPYEVVGIAFGMVGIACVGLGYDRQRKVDDALDRGEYAPMSTVAAFVLSTAGALLGIATVVLLVIHPR